MKVKIGNRIYSVEDQPIMIILDAFDKEYISNMGDQTKYCRFPEGTKISEVARFMEEE
jgi:hypothetical protein